MRQVDIALEKLLVSAFNARKDLHAGQEDSGIDELSLKHSAARAAVPANRASHIGWML
jgi:hypothetical protein